MTFTPLPELLQMPPGTAVPATKGHVVSIGEYFTGQQRMDDGSVRDWSVQDLILEEGGAKILVKVANHNAIGQDFLNQPVHLIAMRKTSNRLSGLKMDAQDGNPILRVSTAGQLDWQSNVTYKAELAAEQSEPPTAPAEPEQAPAPAPVAAPISARTTNSKLGELSALYEDCLNTASRLGHTNTDMIALELFRAMTK